MSVSEPAAVSAATYDKRFRLFGAVAAGIWLIFLAPALQRAWEERSTWVGWVGLGALLGFGALYVAVFQWARPMRRSGGPSNRPASSGSGYSSCWPLSWCSRCSTTGSGLLCTSPLPR